MPKIQNFNKAEIRSNAGRPSKYDFSVVPVESRDNENPSGAVFSPDEGTFKAIAQAARQYANKNNYGSTIRETEDGTLVIFWDQPRAKSEPEKSPAKGSKSNGQKSGDKSA